MLFEIYSKLKNYALQFVLGHQLIPSKPTDLEAGSLTTIEGFEKSFDHVLKTYVKSSGRVDYHQLTTDEGRQCLSNVAQFVSAYSPLTEPQWFDTQEKALCFYLNLYNALVLWGVVNCWPLDSVRNCRAWVSKKMTKAFVLLLDSTSTYSIITFEVLFFLLIKALVKLAPVQPFFVTLHFEVAGKEGVGRGGMNLFELEHSIIRAYNDPRIHAAINCASIGCPSLRQVFLCFYLCWNF